MNDQEKLESFVDYPQRGIFSPEPVVAAAAVIARGLVIAACVLMRRDIPLPHGEKQ
jgi:hypothetical protein